MTHTKINRLLKELKMAIKTLFDGDFTVRQENVLVFGKQKRKNRLQINNKF